jgi:hypothetical protein
MFGDENTQLKEPERSRKHSELYIPEDEGSVLLLTVGEPPTDNRNVIYQKAMDFRISAVRSRVQECLGRFAAYCK